MFLHCQLYGYVENNFLCRLLCLITFILVVGADKIFGLVIADTAITNNYLWNIVTCLMYEKYIAKLICDVALLFVVLPDTSSFKYGPVDQFSLYMGVCLSCCSLGTAGYCFIRFFSTGAESMLFIPVYGFSGILVILSMFVRAKRGNVLISASVPYISYNNLPVLLVAVDMLCWFIRMGWLVYDIPFALIGLCISWSYLRFYYRNEDSENSQYHFDPARVNGPQIMWFTNVLGSKGNFGIHAEEFSFVNMFPAIVYPFVVPLTTAFYNLFVLLGIFPETADSKEGTHYKHAHHLRYILHYC